MTKNSQNKTKIKQLKLINGRKKHSFICAKCGDIFYTDGILNNEDNYICKKCAVGMLINRDRYE